jgi:hypothetical protein
MTPLDNFILPSEFTTSTHWCHYPIMGKIFLAKGSFWSSLLVILNV